MRDLIGAVAEDLDANADRSGLGGFFVALIINPGFSAIFWHRVAASLNRGPIGRLAARLIWRSNVRSTGCHIHLKAKIGRGIKLPHPSGIVIGEGVVLGDAVTIYQSVTLGAKDDQNLQYPVVQEGATIFASAVVLGPVNIGRGAIVAAHALVNVDVPDEHLAVGIPARIRAITGNRVAERVR
jgi:serine O-acetyltransferase